MRITFDSNVLLYAANADSRGRQEIALDLIRRAANADTFLLLQCMAEFFKVATTKFGIPLIDARMILARWRAAFSVHLASEGSFDYATELVAVHRVSFWDAMILAAAREAQCDAILSEDFQDGQKIAGVEIVNPFAPENAARLDRLFGAV